MDDMESAFLLVATPHAEPAFREAVVLVAVHGDEGSLGFLVNRPSACTLADALPGLSVAAPPAVDRGAHAWRGGTAKPSVGWLLFDSRRIDDTPEDSCLLTPEVGVTASPAAMEQVYGEDPEGTLLVLGHLSWESGALEEELALGTWLRAPVDPRLVFDVAVAQRWTEGTCLALGLPRPWLGQARFATA